jgi:DNA modification methylase
MRKKTALSGNTSITGVPYQVQQVRTSDLRPNPRNARTHSPKQISQIAASIYAFGFNNPILADSSNMIVCGHGRWEAAKQLGLKTVPVIRLEHLSPEALRAYVIADNKIALNADWDEEILTIELGELQAADLDFDLAITGFEIAEIDQFIVPATDPGPDPLDEIPEPGAEPVTQPGDVWQVGQHRLICGDARDGEVYFALLGEERAQMVFCDPPYNVQIQGHVSGLGKVKHREFKMASGEMSKRSFTRFLTDICTELANWSEDGSLHYLCMDWRHLQELQEAAEAAYTEQKNLCVWTKSNAGMGSFYRSQHELVLVYKAGRAPHINNVELGRHGRYRTNVWPYAGANSFSSTRDRDLEMHPTVKPVALVADAILDASQPKGIVLDAFAGSGTTLVAAEKTRRRGFGIEIDPIYCDTILARLATVTGKTPILQASGKAFDDVRTERLQLAEGVS